MEASEAYETIDELVYKSTEKHLSDIQKFVFFGSWQGQSYREIADEKGYTPKYLSEDVGPKVWKLLSSVLNENVSKTNFKNAIERYRNRLSPKPVPGFYVERYPIELLTDSDEGKESNVDSAKILLCNHSQNDSFAQELRRALEDDEQEVFITEAQPNNEGLSKYDCFLLLVSSHSASNIVAEEIERVRRLLDAQLDNKLVFMLIHVGSPMSLPLNHALHNKLQGIPQREWPQTDTSTLVQELLGLLEAQQSDEVQTVSDGIALLQNFSKLSGARNWLLTYVGENQFRQLGNIVTDLADENKRCIQSAYSYWGLGPVYMWDKACHDPIYHMKENIDRFPDFANQLSQYVDKDLYNFVSLGVGDGNKDRRLIAEFFNQIGSNQPCEDFLYIPVDMSLEMLRLAIDNIPQLPLHSRIAIQRDIETREGMEEIALIAEKLGRQRPILYGFIGNTIANVEQPQSVLNNIVQVMKDNDLLLFEAQIVDPLALETARLQDTINSIKGEYLSEPFRLFAESALLQNTDLNMSPAERSRAYVVDVDLQDWMKGKLLQIECFFQNNSDKNLEMKLLNGRFITLNLQKKIRLYRSRKFMPSTLQNFVEASDLKILGQSEYLSARGTGFIVMMLRRQK